MHHQRSIAIKCRDGSVSKQKNPHLDTEMGGALNRRSLRSAIGALSYSVITSMGAALP
jgi:hypothetical protein